MTFFSSGQFILGRNILSLFLLFGSIHFWEVILLNSAKNMFYWISDYLLQLVNLLPFSYHNHTINIISLNYSKSCNTCNLHSIWEIRLNTIWIFNCLVYFIQYLLYSLIPYSSVTNLVMTFFNSSGQFILGGNILSLFLLFGSISTLYPSIIPNLATLATYTQFGKLD
jgi:hypothetical protein